MSQKRKPIDREYARKREERIRHADSLAASANELLASKLMKTASDARQTAAENYLSAANKYRLAGLSIMARAAYKEASRLYCDVGMTHAAEACQSKASEIDIVWAGEGIQ